MGMFDKSKTIAAAPAPKKKNEKQKIELAGVEELAMVRALQKAVDTLGDTLEASIKGFAWSHFCEAITSTGRRPENFRAIEGGAAASLELRKRGSNFGLSEEQVTLLRSHGFEPGGEVIVPELFAIAPEHAGNAELMAKVEAALTGIVPDGFIVLQPEKKRHIVTDELLTKAIEAKAPADVMRVLTNVSIKPTLGETNMTRLIDFVRGLLTPTPDAPAANDAQAGKLQKAA